MHGDTNLDSDSHDFVGLTPCPFTEISIDLSRKYCAYFHWVNTCYQTLLAGRARLAWRTLCNKFSNFCLYCVTGCNLIVYITTFRRLANSLCGPPF